MSDFLKQVVFLVNQYKAVVFLVKVKFFNVKRGFAMKSDKPIECVGCNTFDVGSIIDNSERDAKFEKVYATQEQAEAVLAKLVQKARDTETDSCEISSNILPVEAGFLLTANFDFSCQAEVVIFQLGTRAF